ncbi:hypothetical protein [Corynebacterium caspium]|uniref:hypothetical protein n=1 Tax=Corynebacterium caspium TaxID=234828 RepID=UPI0003811B12|nr:hypothetical protein [Corynebacterium caspium]WKD59428.1 hypothetical protein CCASP_05200 [Corynebacterium caspium DSM 44850]
MSYLLRVTLPDAPGSLALLGAAVGKIGGNIHSVDIVEAFPDGTVMDDLVVVLPPRTLPDSLITAAHSLEGVVVDSIRPFSGTVDRRGQIELLAQIAQFHKNPARALQLLAKEMPRTLTSSWVIILRTSRNDAAKEIIAVEASPSAPSGEISTPGDIDISKARPLDPESEAWIPENWALLDTSLAATPISGTDLILVVGRVGGPQFLASEVRHLGYLGTIVGTILK